MNSAYSSSTSLSSPTSTITVTPPTPRSLSLLKDADCAEVVYDIETNSMLSLLDELENCRQVQSYYILVGNTNPINWQKFLQRMKHVEIFRITEESQRDAGRITTSALIRLTEQLKNDFLFPNLREIDIQYAAGTSLKHLSLLISPTLSHIAITWDASFIKGASSRANINAGDLGTFQLAMASFLPDISLYSPNITSFRLSGIPDISHDWLTSISRFFHLCILELTHLVNLGDLKEIMRLLEPLKKLEELILSVDGSFNELSFNSVPNIQILPALHILKITGPPIVHTFFLRTLGAAELRTLTFQSPSSQSDLRSSLIRKGKRGMNDSPTIDIFHALNGRWADTLESIDIVSAADVTCDLKHFIHLKVLQRLWIKGSTIISHSEIFTSEAGKPASWPHLNFLRLSPETISISLLQLSYIARSAPTLRHLVVLVDFQDIPSLSSFSPIDHPLQVLCNMTDNIRQSRSEVFAAYKNVEDDWDEVINVARCLVLIFPKMTELRTVSEFWRRVKKLMDFGRDVCRDKGGSLLHQENGRS